MLLRSRSQEGQQRLCTREREDQRECQPAVMGREDGHVWLPTTRGAEAGCPRYRVASQREADLTAPKVQLSLQRMPPRVEVSVGYVRLHGSRPGVNRDSKRGGDRDPVGDPIRNPIRSSIRSLIRSPIQDLVWGCTPISGDALLDYNRPVAKVAFT
eukprot:CAMPEP_0181173826 /NCGR_PEP_ID=MMETSP1096-20121128/3205_1 /TAXON_ID=156174 ORGANISM="Chrysochromulina ericina, Strain CCMP281" /NCGR_SAMPLE_ID=MMETSP1096 /ASSEMBLY_ACC=CAM_ASM_000453 /LENGTH=155 /DNA_ID=CAMNT_0023261677 /DNA_START=232 /DNA_END=699 /DNA_ORIENTATION=+